VSRADWISTAGTLIATGIGWFIGGTKAAIACLVAGVLIVIILRFKRSKEKPPEKPENHGIKDSFDPTFTQTASPTVHVHVGQPAPTPPPITLKPEEISKPNLVLKGVYLGPLYLSGDIWSRNISEGSTQPVPRYEVIFAEIKNAGKHGEVVGPAPEIRAELVVANEEFTPLSWIDEYYSTVNFKFGDVKYLILAVGMHTQMPSLDDWRVFLNHRTDGQFAQGVSAIDSDRHLKRVVPESKVRLNLLQVSSGQVLNSFEGLCRWPEGYGRPTIYFKRPE
jgi:hypothetical protein